MKIPIETQIRAIELEVVNLAGHIGILRDLIEKKNRDPSALGMKENLLLEMEAALETLRWVQKNQGKLR